MGEIISLRKQNEIPEIHNLVLENDIDMSDNESIVSNNSLPNLLSRCDSSSSSDDSESEDEELERNMARASSSNNNGGKQLPTKDDDIGEKQLIQLEDNISIKEESRL